MTLPIFISIIIAAIFSSATLILLNNSPQPIALSPESLSIIIIGYLLATLLTSIAQYKVFLSRCRDIPSSKNHTQENREQGTVKWFNVNKGFGFITQENGDDIFVHYRSIRGHGRKKLLDGQSVTYTVIDSDRGFQADDVEVLD